VYLIEEFYYSALDLMQFDWAEAFLRIICKDYPKSIKSLRLLAMFYEAKHDLEKAQDIYVELL
jgi:hypothetical protein